MKILVTGVNGLVGKDVVASFLQNNEIELYGIGRADCLQSGFNYTKLDLTDFDSLNNYLFEIKPDAIIHCAAYTKLDECEVNRDYAYKMNVEVTKFLADKASRFVYMSSDAVFSGKGCNYTENDVPDPVNYYGLTKLLGEKEARRNPDALILRSSIFGYNYNSNVSIAEWGIKSLLKHEVITGFDDVIFNPLYSKVLTEILYQLVQGKVSGLYHLGSSTSLSKYEFFKLIAIKLGVDESLVQPVSVDSKTFVAQRTKDTSLTTKKIESIICGSYDIEQQIEMLIEDMESHNRIVRK